MFLFSHNSPLVLYHTFSIPLSNFIRQLAQFFAYALGPGFVSMLTDIFKQGVKSLDRLYRIISLRHRHSLYSSILVHQWVCTSNIHP